MRPSSEAVESDQHSQKGMIAKKKKAFSHSHPPTMGGADSPAAAPGMLIQIHEVS